MEIFEIRAVETVGGRCGKGLGPIEVVQMEVTQSVAFNHGKAFGKNQIALESATPKCFGADGFECGGNGDFLCAGAILKGTGGKRSDTFFNDDFLNDGSIIVQPRSGGHFACAADGEDTFIAQCPCEVVAAGAVGGVVGEGGDSQAAQQCRQYGKEGEELLKTFHRKPSF